MKGYRTEPRSSRQVQQQKAKPVTQTKRRLTFVLAVTTLGLFGCDEPPETWRTETVVTGLPVHGVHGLAFGPDGDLYIGSVMGQSIVRLDVETGLMEDVVGAPLGEADDVAFGPDGSMAWTALNQGELRLKENDGTIRTVATDLPFVNPVTFGPDGTLYGATLFGPDRLWAYNLKANTARVVTENVGGLNAFEFGNDGSLYAPLPMRQSVGKIDVESGDLTIIAEGIGNVVAVKFHPDGFLYGVSWDDGRVIRIDTDSGDHTLVATVEPPLDNLAVAPNGTIYVTRPSDNGVVAIDPENGTSRTVMRSDLAAPGGMTWVERYGKKQLLVTDIFGYRFVDPDTGATEILPFDLEGGPSADGDSRDGMIALTYVRRNRVLLKDASSNDLRAKWADVSQPYGVLIEPTGSVLVASHDAGTVIRLFPNDPDTRTVVATGLVGPAGLAWATDGLSVYVAESGAGRISLITLAADTRKTVAGDLAQPETIALLLDGRVVVAEVGAGQISAIDPDTGNKTVLATSLALGGLISRAPDPVGMPTGIAVGDDGSVYVVTDANNSLIRLVQE